jgi:hypothetical protein
MEDYKIGSPEYEENLRETREHKKKVKSKKGFEFITNYSKESMVMDEEGLKNANHEDFYLDTAYDIYGNLASGVSVHVKKDTTDDILIKFKKTIGKIEENLARYSNEPRVLPSIDKCPTDSPSINICISSNINESIKPTTAKPSRRNR